MANTTTRRTKLNQVALLDIGGTSLTFENLKGIASPVSKSSENLNVRLTGGWLDVWRDMKRELPDLSDSELIRQCIALRACLLARDSFGNVATATASYKNEDGKTRTVDLEEFAGIKKSKKT